MLHKSFNFPAKTLLFGEYGLLEGGVGVAVTLPAFRFEFEVSVTEARDNLPALSIESDYFGSQGLAFTSDELRRLASPELWNVIEVCDLETVVKLDHASLPKGSALFVGALLSYLDVMPTCAVRVKVTKAFPSSLGFGSSSALLAGLHLAMFEFATGRSASVTDARFWRRLHIALRLIQGGGSAYDVACQIAAAALPSDRAWKYVLPKGAFVPQLKQLELDLSTFGSILETGEYSDTASHVAKARTQQNFGERHAALSARFLASPSASALPSLFESSRAIAREQGLFETGSGKTQALCQELEKCDIPFKTLGAGKGDCLWTLADKSELAARAWASLARVVYDFKTREATLS